MDCCISRAGRVSAGRRISGALQTFTHFPREVQAREIGVLALDDLDDAQALHVVLEASVLIHQLIQYLLAGMAERRMAEVVRQRDGLREVFVQAQGAGDRAADRRHFDGVREPGPQVVTRAVEKDLRLVLETPEGP